MSAKCDGCGEEVTRLVYTGNGFRCRDCGGRPSITSDAAIAHRIQVRNKGEARSLTYARRKNIETRAIGPDNKTRPAPRWRTNSL